MSPDKWVRLSEVVEALRAAAPSRDFHSMSPHEREGFMLAAAFLARSGLGIEGIEGSVALVSKYKDYRGYMFDNEPPAHNERPAILLLPTDEGTT